MTSRAPTRVSRIRSLLKDSESAYLPYGLRKNWPTPRSRLGFCFRAVGYESISQSDTNFSQPLTSTLSIFGDRKN
jgi:hypothetical protein